LLIEKYCQPTIIFTGKTYFKIKRSKIATKVSGIRNYTTKRQEEKIQKRWKNGTNIKCHYNCANIYSNNKLTKC
jgi:hypothetical protein